MFILNAFCCGSEEPVISLKNKTVKKVIAEHSNINSTFDSSLSIKNRPADNLHATFVLPIEQKNKPLCQYLTSQSSFKSNQCNPGSNLTSLEDQCLDLCVSPVWMDKQLREQKENDYRGIGSINYSLYEFSESEVREWSVKEVLGFLVRIGMKQYKSRFYENKIKGKDLVSLSQKQLRQDLQISQKDSRTLLIYIQLLKQKVQRQKRDKKTFSSQRIQPSLYKSFSGTYSCRKILNLVINPIMEEETEEDNLDIYKNKHNLSTKDIYSTSNFSELLTN